MDWLTEGDGSPMPPWLVRGFGISLAILLLASFATIAWRLL